MREKLWRVCGIFLGVARSEREDQIEQFINSAMFNNISRDVVRLEGKRRQLVWLSHPRWHILTVPWRTPERPEEVTGPFRPLS